MTWQKVHRKTSSNWSAPKSQFATSTFGSKHPEVQKSPFAPRPFAPVEQKVTPEDIAANEFQQNKLEATRLQIQLLRNTITPSGQERLNLLQAKMDNYWVQRKEIAQSRPGFDLANISITPPQPIQAKLTVGAAGDKYEQEADAMASRVMSMPDAAVQREVAPEQTDEEVQTKPLAAAITPLVQREAMPEEEEVQAKSSGASIQREVLPQEEEVQAKSLNASIQRETLPEEVQTKLSNADGGDTIASGCQEHRSHLQLKSDAVQAGGNIESQLNSSKGGGSPLGDEVRGFMEPRFGHDFSQVRVHTGGDAVQMNRELGAQAFAHGSDIYFGAGKLPGNNELTAHELTHVVQQTGGIQTDTLEKFDKSSKVQHKCEACERNNSDTLQKKENYPKISLAPIDLVQRAAETDAASQGETVTPPVSWASGPIFGSAIELPFDEAARRVNEALDLIGSGLTYIRRPLTSPDSVAANDANNQSSSTTTPNLQAFPNIIVQRQEQDSSPLAKIHGGFVGSAQFCWDCLTGEASIKGWIWAGVGYDAPLIGWVGGYYFGEQTWWKGDLGKWFEPGVCNLNCDSNKGAKTESGWGIAGFPIDIKPGERVNFSRGGLELGFLITPHSLCEGDIELIGLIDILNYFGPITPIVKKAVDGINAVTKGKPKIELQAGVDFSAIFHLCRGKDSLFAVNRANLCGGGFVGVGVGLSHSKEGNHGAS